MVAPEVLRCDARWPAQRETKAVGRDRGPSPS